MTPELNKIYIGDCIEVMKTWPTDFVQTVVTSPPYWGLRDYGVDGQIGLEESPEAFVAKMVDVFREVRRILRPDGTLWMNLGDSYYSGDHGDVNRRAGKNSLPSAADFKDLPPNRRTLPGMKPKDLVGVPWRVALALQADGWYLRSDIIWHKPNPMPESVTDRPGKAHEYIFLLTKSPRYFYDIDAVREKNGYEWDWDDYMAAKSSWKAPDTNENGVLTAYAGQNKGQAGACPLGRNKRTVWTVPSMASGEAHFATFPPDLIKPCILAGTSEKGACADCGTPWQRQTEKVTTFQSGSGKAGNPPEGKYAGTAQTISGDYDIRMGPVTSTRTVGWEPACRCQDGIIPCIVFDPFMGAGTTALVASQYNRSWIGTELNPEYAEIARQRIANEVSQLKFV